MIKSFRIVLLLISLFGFRARYLGLLLFRIAITSFIAFTLLLDRLFFPGVVVTGNEQLNEQKGKEDSYHSALRCAVVSR